MERGSDKHGPRTDDQLAHEVEGAMRGGHSTHAEEWKDPEPSAEGQPDVDMAPDATLTGGVPEGMTAADVEGRSRLAGYLGKEGWPATGRELVERAEAAQAPDDVLATLRSVQQDGVYDNVSDLWDATGGDVEGERF